MRVKTINRFKAVSHVIFILVSIALTVMLFEQLSINIIGKVIFIAMGISMELVKVYLFLFVKFHFKHKRVGFIIGTLYLSVYLSLAGISAIASLGFALNEIQAQSFDAGLSNIDSDTIMRDLEFIDQEIETKVRQQSELPFDYITASERLSTQIRELRQERTELVNILQSREQGREMITADTFSLIGSLDWVDKEGEDVLFFILMFLVIILELVIVLTSGEIIEEKKAGLVISKGEGFELDSIQKRRENREKRRQSTGLQVSG